MMKRTSLIVIVLGSVMFGWAGNAMAVLGFKDSSNFTNKFEMDNIGQGLDPDNTTSDWFVGGTTGGATPTLTGGSLEVDTVTGAIDGTWNRFYQTRSAVWRDFPVDPTIGWTVEVRVKVLASIDTIGGDFFYDPAHPSNVTHVSDRAFQIAIGDDGLDGHGSGDTNAQIEVGLSSVTTSGGGGQLISTALNSDDYHVFRIAKEANVANYHVWRDGVAIGELGTPTNTDVNASLNIFYFGDGTGSRSGSFLVDYVRFDLTGAFQAPEPASLSLVALGGALLLRRKTGR